MKVAIITDQHFGARNDSIHFLDYYEKFYNETFFPTIADSDIDTVFILGDTFDRRKYVNFYSLKRTKEMFFDRLLEMDIKVHMLAGNHDTYFKNTNDVNSINLLLNDYKNINVIDHPTNIYVGEYKVCMMPWICPENYEDSMAIIRKTDAEICMGHFEIAGFAMHRGMPSEEGLNRELFRKFTHTFSGHYHHKSNANDIYYLGNPYELTWQDYGDDRGFHIFDFGSKELTFIKNPNVMFHRLVYDDISETIKEVMDKDLSHLAGCYVKVVAVNKTNPYLFDQFMNKLYMVNPLDITIIEDALDLTEGVEDDKIDEAEDTITVINKYVDSMETMKNLGIDSTRLKNILKELYVEAVNLEQT